MLAAGLAGEIPLIDGSVPSVTTSVPGDESDPVDPFRTRIEKVPGSSAVTVAMIVVVVFVVSSSFDTMQGSVAAHDGPVTTSSTVDGSNPVPMIASVSVPAVAVAGETLVIESATVPDVPPSPGLVSGDGVGVGFDVGLPEDPDEEPAGTGKAARDSGPGGVGALGELAAHALSVTARTITAPAARKSHARHRIPANVSSANP